MTTWFYIGGRSDGADITWTHSGTTVDPQMFEGGVIDPALYGSTRRLEISPNLDSWFTTHGRLYAIGDHIPRPALCQEF